MAASGLEAEPGDVGRPQERAPGVDDEAIVDPQLRLPDRVGHVQGVLAGARRRTSEPVQRADRHFADDLGRQAHRRERGRRAAEGHGLGPGGRGMPIRRRRRVSASRRSRSAKKAAVKRPGSPDSSTAADGGSGLDVLGPAEAHVRRVVPEEPPAPGRDQEGDDDLAVVLPQVQVAAGQVEQAVLVLAEAVERLAEGALELLADHERRLAEGRHRGEGLPAARLLAQQRPAGLVFERHLAGAERDPRRRAAACAGRPRPPPRARRNRWRPRGRSRRARPARAPGEPTRPRHHTDRALRQHPEPHAGPPPRHDEAVLGRAPGGRLGGHGLEQHEEGER